MKPKLYLHNTETRQRRAELIAARQRLAAVGDDWSEVDYLAANQAVIDAEKPLTALQRLDIDAGLHDHSEMEA